MAVKLANYSEPALNRYLHNRARVHGVPLSGNFELTPCCNLQCRMCYVRQDYAQVQAQGGLTNAQQWLEWGQQAAEKGMLFLLLTGGEPLTHPQFKEIYTGLKKMGLMISLNTNGTLIDDDMVEFFCADAPTRINITLYGSSWHTYEKLCGHGDAYEKAIRAIRTLSDRGINVKINFSATPSNADDMADVFQIADECGANVQAAPYMFPGIRRNRQFEEGDRFDPEQAGYAQMQCDRLRYTEMQFLHRVEEIESGKMMPDMTDECLDQPAERISCRAGRSSFWITWNGRMAPCGMMTRPQVDLRACGFEKAWQDIRMQAEQIFLPAKCVQCSARAVCHVCPAAILAETGRFDKAPSYLCSMTDAYLRHLKKMAGEMKEKQYGNQA